jgi:FkbH-like protein
VGYTGRAHLEVQRALRALMRRGVVLAINSKNNQEDAFDVIDRHPGMLLRRDDFAAVRINWQDKAVNLVELSEELGLALDSFVFLDDNAAECERVRQALPEVLTIQLTGDPAGYPDTIRGLGVFDGLSFGDEDRSRTAMYRSETRRRDLQQSMTSLGDFLRSLEMHLDIEPVGAETLSRAAELTQRTNQFNLTTRRFTADELRDYLARPGHEGFVFRLRDRFGEHGIIGLALTERSGTALVIASLLLSCRVLKRTVEDSVVSFLVEHAHEGDAQVVHGLFEATRKNAVAAALYEGRGFHREPDVDGVQVFTRRAADALAPSPWITSRRPERRHV